MTENAIEALKIICKNVNSTRDSKNLYKVYRNKNKKFTEENWKEVLDEKYNEYKEKQEYDKLISERYHINTGLSNYLKKEEGKNDKEIEDIINKFDKDLYLKWEFYNTVMYRNFPYRGRMKEEEIEKIFNEENCSYLNTYLRILEMRK